MKYISNTFLLAITLTCSNVMANESLMPVSNIIAQSLDYAIKCYHDSNIQYSYGAGFYSVGDSGCVYSPKNNLSIGNADVYLIEKSSDSWIKLSEDEKSKLINTLTQDEIKKRFEIDIYMVDKKYLTYFPNGDTPYEAEPPFVLNRYTYDNLQNKWFLVAQQNVNSKNQQDIWQKRDNFIQERVQLNRISTDSKPSSTKGQEIKNLIPLKMSIYKSQDADLNEDGITDKIVALISSNHTKLPNPTLCGVTFMILKGRGNNTFSVWSSNNTLMKETSKENCRDLELSDIVVKKSFFTIELDVSYGDNGVPQKLYPTFKYNKSKDAFILHSYHIVPNQPDDTNNKPITSKTFTCKNSSETSFENFEGTCH